MKVLLEQGNAFSDALTSRFQLRYIIGPYILVGIVLSNAYKNKNVYKMITPRTPVRYEKFGELVRDNFTVFTRTINVFAHQTGYDDAKEEEPTIVVNGDNQSAYITSEIDSLLSIQGNIIYEEYMKSNPAFTYERGMQEKAIENSTLVFKGIKSKSRLHPKTKDITMEIINRFDVLEISTLDKVRKAEMNQLKMSLAKCDRVAIILPDYLCRCGTYIEAAKQAGCMKQVSVGKESYSDMHWMFTLRGFVPPQLIRRFKGISESGIWEVVTKRVTGNKRITLENTLGAFSPAKMNGNVVVIFVVYACGQTLAVVSLGFEYFYYFVAKIRNKGEQLCPHISNQHWNS